MVGEIGGEFINCATCGKKRLKTYRYWWGDLFFCSWDCLQNHLMKINKHDEIAEKEKLFAIAVLNEAKRIFGDDAAKIDAKRMVILVCMVAKELGYPLTMGWYK